MATEQKPPKKKRQQRMTPRQKKLVQLLPEVEAGKLTMQSAMLKAGYAESTAREQSRTLGGIGSNTKMQQALAKAGFTEDYLATGIVEGTKAKRMGSPDYKARGIYYKLGAELMDAFPAKRNIIAEVGIEDVLGEAEENVDYSEWEKDE